MHLQGIYGHLPPVAAVQAPAPDQARAIVLFYGLLVLAGLIVNLYILLRVPGRAHVWDHKMRRLEQRPWAFIDLAHLVLLVVSFNAVLLLAYFVADRLGLAGQAKERGYLFLGHSVAMHWIPLVFFGWHVFRKRTSWRKAFGGYGPGWLTRIGQGLALYVAVIPAIFFYMMIFQLWIRMTGYEPDPQTVVRLFMDLEPGIFRVYMMVLAVLLAPVVEEAVFRGVALPVFARLWGGAPAIFIVAAAFALLHGHIPSLVPLFVFGVALSLAYIYTESLLVPVVMHMAFNGVTLGIMIYVGYL